ncbi:hypothetical protein PLESTB_000038100 [Pleodorina starrii]|uniref:BACK domain-containing protein n=1 Tax=Pleodorina starrii TaxID=330485 RepID=A0A9W6B9Z5_9CHLO|nr:hypothetical protein PLESTB_000038100 [Pleodorina starrii]GLC70664.1 hypothetical protein PLESTF_001019500 [Pleodorina starrii]
MLTLPNVIATQDISQPVFHHIDHVTDTGRLAVQRVAAAVLNATYLDERQLTFALATSTVQHVLAARHLCLVALQASVCPDNCFRLFSFADQCGIAPLRQAAEQSCLASLPRGDAAAQDAAGFAQLPQDQLQRLLQSDGLQVASEIEVFRAIAAWTQAQPLERTPLMAALVRACVRLDSMDREQLVQLDSEPATSDSPEVIRLVAHAYMLHIVGLPSGAGAARPRDSVARAAAAAAAATAMAVPAAAGCGVSGVDPFSRPAVRVV